MAGSLDGLAWHGLIRITPNFVTKSSNSEAKPMSKARSKASLRPHVFKNNLFLPILIPGLSPETAWNRLKPPETAESETAEDLIPSSGYRIKQYVGGLIPGLSPTALGPKP